MSLPRRSLSLDALPRRFLDARLSLDVSPSTLDEIRGDEMRSASCHKGRLASGQMPAATPGQSTMRKFSKEPHGKPVGGMNTLLEDKAGSSVSTPGSPIASSTNWD
jgi:hypothetical protein